jgi:16S rRNA (adenine1518-N6/adenine1519-N6)-dimethyltransferase
MGTPSGPLGARALRELAARHGIRPDKALGQHFLIDPNLARRIASLVEAGPGERVLEVGAGLGSLTVALAQTGAEVLAVELDRGVMPALAEVLEPYPRVRTLVADAMHVRWEEVLGDDPWTMASNLPYNVAVPVVLDLLERAPGIRGYVVMVQREVGERLAAGPGEEAYGAVSVRVAYRAAARVERRVPPSVFWPAPSVDSVLVRLTPREPPVPTEREALFRVVDAGFALVRLGLDGEGAAAVLRSCGLDPAVRAERLGLAEFACLAEALPG